MHWRVFSLMAVGLMGVAHATSLPCAHSMAEKLAGLAEARGRLTDPAVDPQEAWRELWAYKALVDYSEAERDYLVRYAELQGYEVGATIDVRPDFKADDLEAKLHALAVTYTSHPAVVALNLDRTFGYELRESDRQVVQFLSSVHRHSALRILIYSPWENGITRELVSVSGIPLRE